MTRVRWTNPHSGLEHTVGQRVLWAYERRDYAEAGEFGTVLTVPGDGGDAFTILIDAPRRPRRAKKADPDPQPRVITATSDPILPVREAYRRSAERLRAVAGDFDRYAEAFDADSIPLPTAETS